eukprot:767867-Hanusia_phi.AAC.7
MTYSGFDDSSAACGNSHNYMRVKEVTPLGCWVSTVWCAISRPTCRLDSTGGPKSKKIDHRRHFLMSFGNLRHLLVKVWIPIFQPAQRGITDLSTFP